MNSVLFRTLKQLIQTRQKSGQPTDDIAVKVDLFFALGRLTEDEYTELMGMLNPEN